MCATCHAECSEASGCIMLSQWLPQMLRCTQHDRSVTMRQSLVFCYRDVARGDFVLRLFAVGGNRGLGLRLGGLDEGGQDFVGEGLNLAQAVGPGEVLVVAGAAQLDDLQD